MADRPPRIGDPAQARLQLRAIGRSGLAWEWLRRNPDYRALAPASRCSAHEDLPGIILASPEETARWGCLTIEPADRAPAVARLLWAWAIDPTVIEADAIPVRADEPGAIDFRRWASIIPVVPGDRREHLLIGQVSTAVRLDICAGSIAEGPVALRFHMNWSDGADRRIEALRRFLRLCRTGHLTAPAQSFSRGHVRALCALSVHDALGEGASIRDVGIELYGASRVQAEWTAPGESLKSSCRRLIALARALVAGGYKDLLR